MDDSQAPDISTVTSASRQVVSPANEFVTVELPMTQAVRQVLPHSNWLLSLGALLGLAAWQRDLAEGVYLRATAGADLEGELKGKRSTVEQFHLVMYPPGARYRVMGDSRTGTFVKRDPRSVKFAIETAGLVDSARKRPVGALEAWYVYPLEPAPVTLDYTKHGHLLLEVRDSQGGLIYRHPKYHPEPRETGEMDEGQAPDEPTPEPPPPRTVFDGFHRAAPLDTDEAEEVPHDEASQPQASTEGSKRFVSIRAMAQEMEREDPAIGQEPGMRQAQPAIASDTPGPGPYPLRIRPVILAAVSFVLVNVVAIAYLFASSPNMSETDRISTICQVPPSLLGLAFFLWLAVRLSK